MLVDGREEGRILGLWDEFKVEGLCVWGWGCGPIEFKVGGGVEGCEVGKGGVEGIGEELAFNLKNGVEGSCDNGGGGRYSLGSL